MTGSIFFSALSLILLVACLYFGWRRHWLKSAFSLVTSAASFAEAWFFAYIFTRACTARLSEPLRQKCTQLMNLESAAQGTATERILTLAISVLLGTAAFQGFFLVLLAINTPIKKILFSKVTGTKYSAFNSQKKFPLLSALITLSSFLILSFVLLFPLGTASNVIKCAAKNCGYDFNATDGEPLEGQNSFLQALSYAASNPVLNLYGPTGRGFFDLLTEDAGAVNPKTDANTAGSGTPDSSPTPQNKNSDEAEYALTAFMALNMVAEGQDADLKSMEIIASSLNSSPLLSDLAAELVASAAENWKNGREFLHIGFEMPEGRMGELTADVLDTLSGWHRENLIQDIETSLNLYRLLKEYHISVSEILSTGEGGQALLEALSDEAFVEALFLQFSQNDDFTEIIPKIMRFGIGSALDAMHLEMNEEYLIEFDAGELGEEEWRREAAAFSALLNCLKLLKDNEKSPDVTGLLSQLSQLKDSRLLGNFLANLLVQILYNLGKMTSLSL